MILIRQISGTESSIVMDRTVKELLDDEYDHRFSKMMKSIACLSIKVEASKSDDILQLIDMVNKITVEKKTLHLIIPNLDLELLVNKTINFDVIVDHRDKGSIKL